jgi:hypothetical protein
MIAYLTPSLFWFGVPPELTLVPGADIRGRSRRITRTATLDGGAVFNDGGLSEADRTIVLTLRNVSLSDAATIEDIAAHAPCVLSVRSGIFEGYVESFAVNGPTGGRISFLVSRKLA